MVSRRHTTASVAVAAVLGMLLLAAPASRGAPIATCATWTGEDLEATIVGTDGPDVIEGTPGADVIVAGAGDDRVDGGGGSDVICGGDGDDVVRGGQVARGGPGADELSDASWGYGGGGRDHVSGTSYNDVLVGGGGPDVLEGLDGQDNLVGGRGNDHLLAGPGSDFVSADPGDDLIDGSTQLVEPQGGWYVLRCGDWLYWKSPAPYFDAEDIELRLATTPTYHAPVRIDLADGTATSRATGHDTVTGIESATGSTANDELSGKAGTSCLWSFGGDDRLSGRGGDDSLSAGAGADRVRGGAGDDVLSLRTGPATARGGAGNDWLQWSGATDVDLATGVMRNGAGRSTERGIENVLEEILHGGVLRGDAGPNALYGRHVYGRSGDDVLWGVTTDGGSGVDNCLGDRRVRCERHDESDLPYPEYTP